jgi:hypothetical protein
MSVARFRGVVLAGHKQDAIEVPVDPGAKWNVNTQAIHSGRRGYVVRAQIKGTSFDSFVVARSKKFWLLLPAEVEAKAGIATGDEAAVILQPFD